MVIVISHQIKAREFNGEISAEVVEVLKRTSKVALASPISGKGLPPRTRLLKAYATSANGPRRLVYLLATESEALFLLFYRSKNDPVGENISPKNTVFAKQLRRHLEMLHEDIVANQYDRIETDA